MKLSSAVLALLPLAHCAATARYVPVDVYENMAGCSAGTNPSSTFIFNYDTQDITGVCFRTYFDFDATAVKSVKVEVSSQSSVATSIAFFDDRTCTSSSTLTAPTTFSSANSCTKLGGVSHALKIADFAATAIPEGVSRIVSYAASEGSWWKECKKMGLNEFTRSDTCYKKSTTYEKTNRCEGGFPVTQVYTDSACTIASGGPVTNKDPISCTIKDDGVAGKEKAQTVECDWVVDLSAGFAIAPLSSAVWVATLLASFAFVFFK